MRHKTYNVSGTHCRSCELVLEDRIGQVSGVKKVEANYRTGRVRVYYDDQVPLDGQINVAVRNAGYHLGEQATAKWFTRDPLVYFEVVFAAGILFLLYLVLLLTGVFSAEWNFSASPGLVAVLLVGLAAGLSTCMALIGGLVLGISARHAELHPEASSMQKFWPHLYFNLGRLVSFVLLGGLIGVLGAAFRFTPITLGWLTVAVGVVMFFLGLKLTDISPRLSSGGLMLPKRLSRWMGAGRKTEQYSHRGALISGALTFFLPCGFTQAMQVYAISTGDFGAGAVIMGLFALGTAPGLLGIGALTSAVRGVVARFFFRFVALVIIVLAAVNISNGLSLTGVSLSGLNDLTSKLQGQADLSGELQDGKRIVSITQYGNGYSPNALTVQRGVPVKLIINGTNPYSCASSFVIPKFNIYKVLRQGPNEIEFMPTDIGTIAFSCSMGMYRGVINVIN